MSSGAAVPHRAGGVPLLLARPPAPPAPAAGPRPLVLWCPGFNATKESNAAELGRIASLGVLAAGLDPAGHGERRLPDFDARKRGTMDDVRAFMLSLAHATAAELPAVVRALADEGLADPERVALVGVSMGGYVAYRAAADGPPLRAVVSVLGSPEWPGYADSPHARVDAMRRTALLSVTAERDESVPPAAARRLHAALGESDRARYVELPGAPHLVSGAQWEVVMSETLGWLSRHV